MSGVLPSVHMGLYNLHECRDKLWLLKEVYKHLLSNMIHILTLMVHLGIHKAVLDKVVFNICSAVGFISKKEPKFVRSSAGFQAGI